MHLVSFRCLGDKKVKNMEAAASCVHIPEQKDISISRHLLGERRFLCNRREAGSVLQHLDLCRAGEKQLLPLLALEGHVSHKQQLSSLFLQGP